MTNTEILALLENKFQGVRKDSLGTLAATLTMMSDEEAKKFIEGLDSTRLNQFVTEDRKSRDAEISKAIATYKQKNPEPQPPTTPPAPPTPPDNGGTPDLAKMIADAVANAVTPLTAQIQTLKTERDTTARLGVINNFLNSETNLPQSYKDMLIANFNAQNFADENAFNAYLETQKSSVQKFKQELIDNGFAGHNPLVSRTNSEGLTSGVEYYLNQKSSNEFKGKAI